MCLNFSFSEFIRVVLSVCFGNDSDGFFRDLERRIVEAEMDLTLAKSQGYLKNNLQQKVSSSGPFLAVIGVYTGFGSRLKRNGFRGSWMPKGQLVVPMKVYILFFL